MFPKKKLPNQLVSPQQPIVATSSNDMAHADDDEAEHDMVAQDVRNAQDIKPKILPDVAGPTKQELELHNATHIPYRS